MSGLPSPIVRFLGTTDEHPSALELLGVDADRCSPAEVRAALDERLRRVSRHPESATAEADEVRLALHSAAAQLLDGRVRAAMLGDPGGAAPADREPPKGGGGSAASRPAPIGDGGGADHDLARLVVSVVAHAGGWNDEARRRIGAIAHARGVDPRALGRAVAAERAGAPRRVHAAPASEHGPRPAAAVAPRTRRSLRIAALVLLGGSLIATALLVGIVRERSGGDPAGADPARTGATGEPLAERVPAAELARTDPTPDPADRPDADDLLGRLRAARQLLPDDPPAALAELRAVNAAMARAWPELDPAVVRAAPAELVSFTFAGLGIRREAGLAAFDILATPVGSSDDARSGPPVGDRRALAAAAWAAGLAARHNVPDAPVNIGARARSALLGVRDDGATARGWGPGVAVLLDAAVDRALAPRRASDSRAAWANIAHLARALARTDRAVADRVVLDALERAMSRVGRRVGSRAAHDGVVELVPALNAVSSRERAARLLAWFDDPGVPTAGIALLTDRLVYESLIPGLDVEMVLSPDATAADRSSLRDAYALRLGREVGGAERLALGRWTRSADALLDEPVSPGEPPIESLARSAVYARLSESAAWLWAGDADRSVERLDDATPEEVELAARAAAGAEPKVSDASLARLTAPAVEPDGAWARSYLAAGRSAENRLALINDLRSAGGPSGPADADILARAALTGGPVTLRRAAQRVLMRSADDPAVVHAVLETLYTAASRPDVSEAVELVALRRLPASDDPSWRPAAQRAVTERLLELIAAAREPRTAGLVGVLADAYDRRLSAAGSAGAPSTPTPTASVEIWQGPDTSGDARRAAPPRDLTGIALRLLETRDAQAARYAEGAWTFVGLAELRRRAAARSALTRGEVQRFAAAQTALAETFAALVAAERPSRAPDAERIYHAMIDRRRDASHVYEQLRAAERAMVELWSLRLGVETGS